MTGVSGPMAWLVRGLLSWSEISGLVLPRGAHKSCLASYYSSVRMIRIRYQPLPPTLSYLGLFYHLTSR